MDTSYLLITEQVTCKRYFDRCHCRNSHCIHWSLCRQKALCAGAWTSFAAIPEPRCSSVNGYLKHNNALIGFALADYPMTLPSMVSSRCDVCGDCMFRTTSQSDHHQSSLTSLSETESSSSRNQVFFVLHSFAASFLFAKPPPSSAIKNNGTNTALDGS